MRCPLLSMALLAGWTGAAVFAVDAGSRVTGEWPQWRGPARDSSAASFQVPETWPANLHEVWATEVGPSDAGPVVAHGTIFTFTRDGDREVVTALDLEDGSILWRNGYDAPYQPMMMVGLHGAGPFSTPLASGGRVFTLGIKQVASAWEATTGKLLWQRAFASEFKVAQPFYGNALSPLMADGKLVLEIGGGGSGALVALDPDTGKDVWRLPGDGPAYGSPIVAELAGTTQIVTLTQRRLIGVDARTGQLLWETPFQVDADNTSLTPVQYRDLVILGAAKRPLRAYRVSRSPAEYRTGDEPAPVSGRAAGNTASEGVLSSIPGAGAGPGFTVDEVWSTAGVSLDYSTPVVAGGSLVAFASQKKGQLVVVDPATGAVTWSAEGRQGDHAYLVASGSTVLAFLVGGDLEVASIADGRAEIAGRYTVASSEVWSHPVVLDHHLLTKDRSHLRLWAIAGD